MEIGVALWTMQSTAAHPLNLPVAYAQLRDDARLVESLGFHSLWLAEHRFWYDAWCPSPLVAAAAAASATTTLRIGTAMLLLPQRDAEAVARETAAVDQLSGGRLDLGVALGYRDEEYDGLGLARRDRGRRMEEGLRILHDVWAGALDPAPMQDPHPPVWIGGMAGPALERGARWGCDFMLPPTLSVEQVAATVARIQAAADTAGVPRGRIGMVKDAWVDHDGDRARAEFLPDLTAVYREYGSWWIFKGQYSGYERPDLVEKQVTRSTDAALVGTPDEITSELSALRDVGVDLVALHLNRAATRSRLDDVLHLTAAEIVPRLVPERSRP